MSRAKSITVLPGLKARLRGRKLIQIARDLNLDRGFLSQLASCKRGASLATACALATYLDTSIESLLLSEAPGRAVSDGSGPPRSGDAQK